MTHIKTENKSNKPTNEKDEIDGYIYRAFDTIGVFLFNFLKPHSVNCLSFLKIPSGIGNHGVTNTLSIISRMPPG